MLIDDEDADIPQSSFGEELDKCNELEREVRLEPDTNVNGALAFRLAGNRTHGVFIRHVNQKSKQSEILHKGDQILEVNGINVRRLTCDQIASILRLAVYNNGYVLLQIGASRQKRDAKGALYEVTKDENSNLHYCYPVHAITHSNSSILPTSSSDMTGLSESSLRAQAVSCSLHYSENLSPTKCLHLVRFDEISEQPFSSCKQRKKNPMFGYIKDIGDEMDWRREVVEECSVCSNCSAKRRWHILKHQWATSAMKLLPKSASDFFGRRIYQKAYYNLI